MDTFYELSFKEFELFLNSNKEKSAELHLSKCGLFALGKERKNCCALDLPISGDQPTGVFSLPDAQKALKEAKGTKRKKPDSALLELGSVEKGATLAINGVNVPLLEKFKAVDFPLFDDVFKSAFVLTPEDTEAIAFCSKFSEDWIRKGQGAWSCRTDQGDFITTYKAAESGVHKQGEMIHHTQAELIAKALKAGCLDKNPRLLKSESFSAVSSGVLMFLSVLPKQETDQQECAA